VWNIDEYCPGKYSDILNIPFGLDILYNQKIHDKELTFKGDKAPEWITKFTSNYCYTFFDPNELVLEQIKKFLSKINNLEYNAVHIRRTDHTRLAQKNKQFTSDTQFCNYISQSELPVYLATDCMSVQNSMINTFGIKILWYQKINKRKTLRQTSLLHSMIDIVLCAKSIDFFGSGYSSYSHFISMLKQHKYA